MDIRWMLDVGRIDANGCQIDVGRKSTDVNCNSRWLHRPPTTTVGNMKDGNAIDASLRMWRCKSPRSSTTMVCKRIFFFLLDAALGPIVFEIFQGFLHLLLCHRERERSLFLLCYSTHARSSEDFRWWYPWVYYTCDRQVARGAWRHNCFLRPYWNHGRRRSNWSCY